MVAKSKKSGKLGWRTESDGSIHIDMRIDAEEAKLLRYVALPGDTVASAFRRLCAHAFTQQEALGYYSRRQAILEKILLDAQDNSKALANEYRELSKEMCAVSSNTSKIVGRARGSERCIVELANFIAAKAKELEKSKSSMECLDQRYIEVLAALEDLAEYINKVADKSVAVCDLIRNKNKGSPKSEEGDQ